MKCDIMIIQIKSRRDKAPHVQELLTQFGCSIKVRLGLHETENVCSEEGILILQLTGDQDEMKKLEKALNQVEGVKAKLVVFDD
jgi:ribose 5-phosphate isomerase